MARKRKHENDRNKKCGKKTKTKEIKEQGTQMMREKLNKTLAEANGDITKIKIKKGNKLIQNPDGTFQMVMTCVRCHQEKERVPIHFKQQLNGKNWKSCPPGFEYVHNSKTTPCIECYNQLNIEHSNTESGKIDSILKRAKIPLIEGRKWIKKLREKQDDKFVISGLPMNFASKTEWMPSVQNLINGYAHKMETCELIEAEFNVSQHDAIPNIAQAVIKIFSEVGKDTTSLINEAVQNWKSAPKDNGVTAKPKINGKSTPKYKKQLRAFHLYYIISNAVFYHIKYDYKSFEKNEQRKVYTDKYRSKIIDLSFKKLVYEQQFKCAYSHAPLSITNSAQRFSFERVDNNKPHFGPEGDIDNIVFICRVFNSPVGMNRRKFLQCYLSQKHVPLTEDVRNNATEEYNELCTKNK